MKSNCIMRLLMVCGLSLGWCSCFAIDWNYTMVFNDETWVASIYGVPKDTKGVLNIPSSIDGHTVYSIASGAFEDCDKLEVVVLPYSIHSVGVCAFQRCHNLRYVDMSACKTRVLGDSMFWCCTNLQEVSLPTSLTNICRNAFFGCHSLSNITIPASVEIMKEDAFGSPSVSWYNPNTGVTSYANEGCTSLYAVHISNLAAWCQINFESATANPLYYASRLYLNGDPITNLNIPSSVKRIKRFAFANYSGLSAVTIPDSVKIDDSAFSHCPNLTSVTIGSGVACVQGFRSCDRLTNLTLSDGVKSIGVGAFSECSGLTSVTIPNSVTNIEASAFWKCSRLTSVMIPDSVLRIGNGAFYGCRFTSMIIPSNVTNIAEDAFGYCNWLTNVFLATTYTGTTTNRFTMGINKYPIPITRYVPAQTITFNTAGGTLSSYSKTVHFNSPYGFLPVPIREGYGFMGWHLNGEVVTGDTVVRALDDHTLTAEWAKNGYTLSFDANGGTGEMVNIALAYDVEVSLPQNTFHRRNYVFAGWATNATDEAALYGDGVTVSNMTAEANATLTLYAVWAPLVVATPESTPESGTTFGTDTCTVSLSCATEGSAIYYSTNGVTPRTSAANLYSEPFEVSGDVTVIAVAKFEDVRSDYMTATFTKGAPAVPVIEPCDGTMFVDDSCEVSISCGTEGVAIYYSTNGIMPQKSAAYRYTGPFSISATTTIKAFSANDTFDSECISAKIIKWDMTLAEAVGAPALAFTTGGDSVWTAIADNTSASGYSAKSGEIGDAVPGGSNITWLATAVTGAGTLGFDWKVACEHDDMGGCTWDRLIVFTNDVEAARIDGVTGWEGKSFVFDDSGVHTVRWVFLKDDTNDEMFEDCAWVSGVTWTPSGVADIVVDVGGGKTVTVPGAWIAERTQRAATDDAANGRKVWECYVLGLDPEDNSATNDFKITSFPLKADGTPDLANIVFNPPQAKWNVPATYKVKGAASLSDTEWPEVTEGNKATFRFFKVEVLLP